MHFPNEKLIFIHIPKTAGNWVQKCLEKYSDDSLIRTSPHQDMIDRFDVKGRLTQHGKHQTLNQAFKQLPINDQHNYKFFAVIRDPVSRLLSLYFSPHRWLVNSNGKYKEKEKYFDLNEFSNLVSSCPTMLQHLVVQKGTKFEIPDNLHLVRYEHFKEEIKILFDKYKFTIDDALFERRVNVGAASEPLFTEAKNRDDVKAVIAKSNHAHDFRYFGYEL